MREELLQEEELEELEEESRRFGPRTYVVLIFLLIFLLLGLATTVYCLYANSNRGRFPDQTYINGVDVSGLTATRAKSALASNAKTYTLTIVGRDGSTEVITAEDINLTYVDKGDVDALLNDYNPYEWFFDGRRVDELTASTDTTIDETLAQEVIVSLSCLTDYVSMQDAQVVLVDDHYEVQEAIAGTELNRSATIAAILEALRSGVTELNLEEAGLYLDPTVEAADPDLIATAQRLNGYMESCITMDFGDDRIYTIDASVISGWIAEDEDGVLNLNYDLVFNYVKTQIAYKVDTFGLTHTVTTHSGYVIELTGGDYGWCLSRQNTTEALIAAVEAGYVGEGSPSWLYSAQNLGVDDIGGTYIEVSISEQTMWCYKNYEVVVETPIVTGNISKGNGTPYGSVWAIDGMAKDVTLGTLDTMGYASPVKYWMPFSGDVGIHDADGWRTAYGGSIYLTNGSHGCVNTPEEAMAQIYKIVTVGTAVVVYDLSDTSTVIVSAP